MNGENDYSIEKYSIGIGLIYFATSTSLIFLQIVIFYTFYKNPILLDNTIFKIMKLWGIFTIFQQTNHFISSIYTIFYVLPPKIILRIFGSFLQCGYLTSVICALLLTLNRFDSIYHHRYFKFIDRDKFFKYGIYFCYLYAIVVLCIYNVPDFGYYFYLQTLSFQYDTDQDKWRYVWEYENKSAFVILTFCLFIYINIFLKVLCLRKQSLTESYKFSDIKLLIPALFEILLTLSLETLWEYWLEPNSTSVHKFVILNYLFIIVSGTNTISSVLVIKEVQNTATFILRYKSKQSITRIISIAYAKKL